MKKLLILLALLCGRLNAASIIAYYPFATDAVDQVNGYATTNNGPVPFTTIAGVQCAGPLTNGAFFEITSSAFKTNFQSSTNWEVDFRAYLVNTGGVDELVDMQSSNGCAPYGTTIYYSLGGLLSIYGNIGCANMASGLASTGAWHYIQTSYDGTTVYQYIDGSLSNSSAFSATIGTLNNFYVGLDPNTGGQFPGYISNLVIWGGANCTGSTCVASTPTVTPTFTFSPTLTNTPAGSPTNTQTFTFSPTPSPVYTATASPTTVSTFVPTPTPPDTQVKRVKYLTAFTSQFVKTYTPATTWIPTPEFFDMTHSYRYCLSQIPKLEAVITPTPAMTWEPTPLAGAGFQDKMGYLRRAAIQIQTATIPPP